MSWVSSAFVLGLLLHCFPRVKGDPVYPPPQEGRTYILFNDYSGDNPYQYLAWTTNSAESPIASSGSPGLFMAQGAAGVEPPQSGWTFDQQSDGTYRIYNTDNSYGSTLMRLDIQRYDSNAYEPLPYLNPVQDDASQYYGQVWALPAWGNGYSFEIYNAGWQAALDVNGPSPDGSPLYSNVPINAPIMNYNISDSHDGQHWQLSDVTPVENVTATIQFTQTSTYTPPSQTSSVGGPGAVTESMTITSISTYTETITSTVSANLPRNLQKRQLPPLITDTHTIATVSTTQTITTTLAAPTVFVTNTAPTVTETFTSTSTSTTSYTIFYQVSSGIGTTLNPVGATKSTTIAGFTNSANPNLTNSPSPTNSAVSNASSSGGGLSLGSKIGIGLAVPAVALGALGLLFAAVLYRRKHNADKTPQRPELM